MPNKLFHPIKSPTHGTRVITIDLDDQDLFHQHRWYIMETVKGSGRYYVRSHVMLPNGKKSKIYLHRLLMSPCPGMVVDHINGDTFNNTRDNLRVCTHKENARNSRKRCDNKSGYKGVFWSNRDRRWQAQIMVNQKCVYVGQFKTPEEAYEAYCSAAICFFGEFARTA